MKRLAQDVIRALVRW